MKDSIQKTVFIFSLTALLSCGSSLPNIKDVTELAPPQNVSISPENEQITIIWDTSIHEDKPEFAGYNLYYSRKSLMFAPIKNLPPPVVLGKNQHSYTLDNLDPTVKHFVHVRSRDLDGNLSFPSLPEVIIPPASSF